MYRVMFRSGVDDEETFFAHSDEDLQELTLRLEARLGQSLELVDAEAQAVAASNAIRRQELFIAPALGRLMHSLERKGLAVKHLLGGKDPLYLLVDGEDGPEVPVYSLQDILDRIRELGRKGLAIQRYKGLGEMNPEQLWETTMEPARRKLKKVMLEDAVRANDIFDILMGDDVEPRRAFILENALNVHNLDI